MSNKVRSARGVLVDMALLEMKSKLVDVKPSDAVVQRKAKIEARPVYVEAPTEEVIPEEAKETGIINQTTTRKRK